VIFGEDAAVVPDLEPRCLGFAPAVGEALAETDGLSGAEHVCQHHVGDVLEQSQLHLATPHDTGGDQDPKRGAAPALAMLVQRVEHGLREGIAHDHGRVRLLAIHRIPELQGVEAGALQGDDRPARAEGPDGGEEPRAVHQRAGRDLPHDGPGLHDVACVLGNVGGSFPAIRRRIGAVAEGSPEILGSPHHALGHAGGATGVEKQEVVG
jgi:hypothetical protein